MIAKTIASAALIGAALALAPTAHADVNSQYDAYFDDLHAAGLHDPSLSLGNTVCLEEAHGYDSAKVQRDLIMVSDSITNLTDAATFKAIADKDLCT